MLACWVVDDFCSECFEEGVFVDEDAAVFDGDGHACGSPSADGAH